MGRRRRVATAGTELEKHDGRPLRVLVDGLSARTAGGGTYLVRQVEALAQRDDVRLTVYASGAVADRLIALGGRVAVHRRPRPRLFLRVLWEQTVLPLIARRYDVLYMPANFAVFASPRPQVVTFQNPNHFGELARRVRRRLYGRVGGLRLTVESLAARLSLRRATSAIAVSESLKRTIEEDVGRMAKLRVVRSATPIEPQPTDRGGDGRYVLVVSNDYPHKDWDGLISTFEQSDDLPPLWLVGWPRSPERLEALRDRLEASGSRERVRFVGGVEDRRELGRLYSDAACYVAHSFLEAFPLTPYEAMAHGLVPVVSDIPSHREICGANAIYYEPDDLESIAAAIREGLRTRMQPTRLPELFQRSWDENAAELAAALAAAADRDGVVPRPR